MGETTEVHSADGWAGYIVDQLRNRPLSAVDSHYKDVFGEYIDHAANGTTDEPDRERIARYLASDPVNASSRETEEAYWDGIRDDFATFLQDVYATEDADTGERAAQRDDLTVEQLYTPGACAVDTNDLPPSVIEATWLTSIITAYADEDADDVYIHHVAYLEEDSACEAVQHLLKYDQEDTVERVFWKSIRRGYDAPMQGFAEELDAAGETAIIDQVLEKAADRHYTTEVAQIRDAINDL